MLTAQEDLQRATELGRVLFSQDDDLPRKGTRLQLEYIEFGGIVYAHQLRVGIGGMVDDLELIATATSSEQWQGRIEFLPL